MTITKGNILHGPATSLTVGSTNLGPTLDGVKFEYTEEWIAVEVDQSPMMQDVFLAKCEGKVKTTLAYADLATLGLITGGSGFGRRNAPVEAEIVIVGPGALGKTRTATIHRGFVKLAGDYEMLKDKISSLPIEIWIASDETKPEGQHLISFVDA